nr:MAG: replication associated protein [Cressdnaviricota sp.]
MSSSYLIDDEASESRSENSRIEGFGIRGGVSNNESQGILVTPRPSGSEKTTRQRPPGSRMWMMTVQNPDPAEDFTKWMTRKVPDLKFMVWSYEMGDKETGVDNPAYDEELHARGELQGGNLHYQVYFETRKQYRLTAMRTHIGHHWLEISYAPRSAEKYCCKADHTLVDGPWEFGEPKKPGDRSDIHRAVKILKEDKDMRRVAEQEPVAYVKFNKGLEKYQSVLRLNKKRAWRTELHILWGVPGSGKTFTAFKEAGEDVFKLDEPNSANGSIWWDGYEGHESVIIEEFEKNSFIPFGQFIQLADEYPMQVQVKGGSKAFLAKKIFVTANRHYDEWWHGHLRSDMTAKAAFERRVTSCREFTTKYKAPEAERPLRMLGLETEEQARQRVQL